MSEGDRVEGDKVVQWRSQAMCRPGVEFGFSSLCIVGEKKMLEFSFWKFIPKK